MDWKTELSTYQKTIETALEGYAGQWPDYGPIREAMAYSLLSGGKRIRPVLTLAVCRLFGGEEAKALPLACGLEMMHTSSLIHDDLPCMDDDDLRRGKPTNHKVYGEDMAVLAGDALIIAAFETLADPALPSDTAARAVNCLAKAAGPAGMVGGQVLDLLGEGKTLNYEQIETIQKLKTGCMIEAAARLGAIAAGSTHEQEEAAAAYARCLGLAFQIRDDMLDVIGDEATFGKPIGSDEENEKSTFVSLLGLEECQQTVEALTRQAEEHLAPYKGREFLCALAGSLAVRNK